MSALYEHCPYCGDWVSSDDLALDENGCLRCLSCQEGMCVACREGEPAAHSNLCRDCVEERGLAPLLDLVGHAVRVLIRDERVWGIARALLTHGGSANLLLACQEGADCPVDLLWLPEEVIARIELCVREPLGSLPQRRRFRAWLEMERRAEAIMGASEASEGAVPGGAGAGARGDAEDDDGLCDDDGDGQWEQGGAAASAGASPAGPERRTSLEVLLDVLEASRPLPSEDDAIDGLAAEGIIVDPREPRRAEAEPRERAPGARSRGSRLTRLLRRLRPDAKGRDGRGLSGQGAGGAEVGGR